MSNITRNSAAWLRCLVSDHSLSHEAFRVAYALAVGFYCPSKGIRIASLPELVKVAALPHSNVLAALTELLEAGHLCVNEINPGAYLLATSPVIGGQVNG